MTGIVVVSHSRALAEEAVALAGEMVHGKSVRICVAAGLGATAFGTDAVAIMDAITGADDGTGVVVLMDLGSAVLSAEMALDLIDPDLRERVVLSAAPLVEGLVVAAVAAAGGGDRYEVAAEAAGALAAKQSHVGSPTSVGTVPVRSEQHAPREADVPARSAVFEVTNAHGLHARPAARLVQEARLFDARIELRNQTTGAGPVPATSLSKVATLSALRGHQVEVFAAGSQAQEALEHMLALAGRRFDERDSGAGVPVAATASRQQLSPGRPVPASPGIAIGPAVSMQPAVVQVPDEEASDPTAEWRRLSEALLVARSAVQRVRADAARDVGEAEAAIFDAHLMLLDDTDLLDEVRRRIDAGDAAPRAWADTLGRAEAELAALEDPCLRARAGDVRAVGQHVARALVGVAETILDADGVLIADELTPAQVAGLDLSRVRGIVLALGSPTGHGAILARARGIPAVVGAGSGLFDIAAGTTVALDGSTGEIVVDPSSRVLAAFRRRDRDARVRVTAALAAASSSAVTGDGVEVLVAANVGSVEDAKNAASAGADLVGLVRTEFLFLDRDQPPDIDEQVDIYRRLASASNGRRLTLRTLDVGGDKPLAYAPQVAEANPFLGVRGIRFALAQHDLLHDQLTAIVQVAHETPVSVMFPMVSTVEELAEARRRLDLAVASIGRGQPAGLQVGIMVEVPSTALKAASFVSGVDFFSIGTNDLTQYALAAERGNPSVAALADPLDPGVLRLVDAVCRAAGDRALVAVCGEAAADERAARLLVALGVRELSVSPPAVPGVKQAVRAVAVADDSVLAGRCLAASGPAEVRAVLDQP